jgi:prefoldin subunit 5
MRRVDLPEKLPHLKDGSADMVDEIQTARELATHTSDIKHLQDDVDAMREDISDIKLSLENINNKLASAEGGWKMLIAIGSFAGGLVGAILGFISGKAH